MNERLTDNNRAEPIAQKINQVVEQTNANSHFAATLEERLRNAHSPKTSGVAALFKQVSPTLRWVALMILLGLVLSLSIKTLIPAPQPAAENTPTIPDAIPTSENTDTTPPPQGETFDYDGAQLIMNVPFPDAPAQVNVYTAFRSQPATAEYVQALAVQFGIEGGLYTNITQGQSPDGAPLMVTDGKQELLVYSQNNYQYTSDRVKSSRNYTSIPHENAETIIREYMQTHGFDFNFSVEAEGGSFGGYLLRQLSPDGLPMESDTQGSTRVTLDEDGNILSISMSIIDYEPASLGNFGIRTATEALQQMTAENYLGGSVQSGGSAPDPDLAPPQYWYHDYADNQTVTVYGNVVAYPAVDSNAPAILFFENVPIAGNIDGMNTLDPYTFVQATGQFVVENGVRKLNIESWNQDVQMTCAIGSARRAGEQTLITSEPESSTEYTLVEPPADLPLDTKSILPDSQLVSCGAAIDGQFYWTSIQFYTDSSQMGGGGGGGGFFYQLNLSGTPVPFPTTAPTDATLPPFDYTVVDGDTCASIGMAFGVSINSIVTTNNLPANCIISVGQHLMIPYPTPTSGQSSAYSSAELASFPSYTVQPDDTLAKIAESYNVSVDDIVQANSLPNNNTVVTGSTLIIPITRLEGERGVVNVQVYEKPDGRQRTSYTFATERYQAYYQLQGNNLETLKETMNRPVKIWGGLSVDETGMAFITVEKFEALYPDLQFQVLRGTQETKEIDGAQAILFNTGGTTYIQLRSDGGYPDYNYGNGEEVILEALQVPDETYAGYPAIRVFMMAPAINPTTGDPMELPRTAETIEVLPDPFGNADQYISPDTIIEKVELVYYVSDPTSYDDTLDPAQVEVYLQPVWYFQGHNENGDVVNIYIQALKQEYLLPETTP